MPHNGAASSMNLFVLISRLLLLHVLQRLHTSSTPQQLWMQPRACHKMHLRLKLMKKH